MDGDDRYELEGVPVVQSGWQGVPKIEAWRRGEGACYEVRLPPRKFLPIWNYFLPPAVSTHVRLPPDPKHELKIPVVELKMFTVSVP